MRAAWYERQGPAREVLTTGTLPDPLPGPGELRIRVAVSAVNPGDVKKRLDTFGYGMPFPRVIPHSDGAGVVDLTGEGVATDWLGQRVWCYGAQSYRAFGTSAEYTLVPVRLVAPLPDSVSFEQGACLGIPGITAHRAVHVAGSVSGRTVLVHGGAGAVGVAAVQLARRAGARVIATVRSSEYEAIVRTAGAHVVIKRGGGLADAVRAVAPEGVDHIVDVAFGSNITVNTELVASGGSIAAYASDAETPAIPFWPLVFKNVRVFFLGSDDFPPEDKIAAAGELNAALAAGWSGFEIAARLPLADIARAHELVEAHAKRGRVVVTI